MARERRNAIGGTAGGRSEDALELGRWLFRQPCRFVLGAAEVAQVPETALPEVAFAGRSNVGKSSLLNALLGMRGIARVSKHPGRTQQINFFELGQRLMLADLPGYGYAKASKSRVRNWTELVEDYLKGRQALRRVCLLVDARHGLKESDLRVATMLDEAAQSYQAVLTKCDKLQASEIAARVEETALAIVRRPAAHPDVIATSARAGGGIDELRAQLAALAG